MTAAAACSTLMPSSSPSSRAKNARTPSIATLFDTASRRSGSTRPSTKLASLNESRRHRAAIAVHHQQIAAEARLFELGLQAIDVAVEDRLHGGVDRRGGAAFVLAKFRQQQMAERHIVVRPQRAHDLAGAQFM